MKELGVVAILFSIEFLDVIVYTVSKAAMKKGMNDFVFVMYSNAFATCLLLPITFFFYRKRPLPPLTYFIVAQLFINGFLSCSVQMLRFFGIGYSSPTLATAMSDLIPAFTFILAIVFRMEKLDWKTNSTRAKSIGTLVSITGALIITLYKGQAIINNHPSNKLFPKNLNSSEQFDWVVGAVLLAGHSFVLSLLFIVQTWIIRNYPAELVIVVTRGILVAMLSIPPSLISVTDPKDLRLGFDVHLIAIALQAIFGVSLRSIVHIWVMSKKGPLYVAMFKPIGIIFAVIMGIAFLGDSIYLGSVLGAAIVVIGFYAVIWGKSQEQAKEECEVYDSESYSPVVPLLKKKKMEEEQNGGRFDLIILGASGFTGKYVLREALKFLNTPSSPLKSIAIAGRSPQKLTQALQWASRPNPPPSLPILTADTADPSSLRSLCARTGLLLNCVGPFRLHGEPVVAACAAAGCDYLDISGEPEFMERVEAAHHERAVETGALVVSACGFDSVPAELGVMFNSRQWMGPAAPNRVEAYVALESEKRIVGNFATYESAVLGVANAHQLQQLRRSRPRKPRPQIPGPPTSKGETIENNKKIGLWAVKLPSADSIVVRRTLGILTENLHGLPGLNESAETVEKREAFWSSVKPAHFGVKIGSKSFLGILRIIMVGVFIGLFGSIGFGRQLLLKFPEIFSLGWFRKNGPSEEEVESASFKMWFVGHGYSDGSIASQGNTKPDMEIVTRVMGPEVGYLTTPIILIQCALVLLCQRDSLPKGGVYPPGIIFGPTDLQERLQQNGISFDVISKSTIS